MAPHKSQAKAARSSSGHAKKQPGPTVASASRSVVLPAIPLTLMQKQPGNKTENRKLNHAEKAPKHIRGSSTAPGNVPVSSLEAALVDHVSGSPDVATSPSAKPSNNEVKDSNMEKPGRTTSSATGAQDSTTSGLPVASDSIHQHDDQASRDDLATEIVTPSSANSKTEVEAIADPLTAADNVNSAIQGAHNGQSVDDSQPQSAKSPVPPDSTRSMPPPTIPVAHHQAVSHNQMPNFVAFHPPPHVHHHYRHASNGVPITFGLPDSHTPSPVPVHGGFVPPQALPHRANGEIHMPSRMNGHHLAQVNGNGHPGPISTHFRPDMVPLDAYGSSSGPMPRLPLEQFVPGGGRYGPPTPHSFHGSHTSGEPNGVDSAPPSAPGGPHFHGHHEHPMAHPRPGGPFPPFMHPGSYTRRPSVAEDEFDLMDGVTYFQKQFDNRELSDCVLELYYANNRHHPFKITGHKLILARSPALKQHIMAANTADSGSQAITIKTEDVYLRSDAWWSAVQRLYLHPLLTLPPIMGSNANGGIDFAGDKVDRFDFCLGYAAAGHLLGMREVLVRGLQVASHLLNWNTIEEALGFVVAGTVQRHTSYGDESGEQNMPSVELEFGYGPETKILLMSAIGFLINEFPPNFEFHSSVNDPVKYARIPISTNMARLTSPVDRSIPAIARGTNMRNPSKQHRMPNIKFGDLPAVYPGENAFQQRNPAQCSPVLSRILLNLPFDELCEVLASGSNGVLGWNTAQERYHAVADVVSEREVRRLRAVEAVRSGSIPHSREIQHRLSAQRRHAIAHPWDVLNWQEEVVRPNGAEVPRIVRTWVAQFSSAPEQQLHQQAQSSSYENRDSMV